MFTSTIAPVFVVAGLVLRRLWRGGTIVLLFLLVGGGILIGPAFFRAQLQPQESFKLWLQYAGQWTVLLLSLAALLLGAGVFADDLAGRRLQLVVLKPVSKWQIWLGYWLGLMLACACVLSWAGILVGVKISWAALRDPSRRQAYLAVRRPIAVTPLSAASNGMTIVAVGGAGRWQVVLPARGVAMADSAILQFNFLAGQTAAEGTALRGAWQIKTATDTQTLPFSVTPGRAGEVAIPMELLHAGATLELVCLNTDDLNPATLLFPGADSVKLFISTGAVAGNMLRAGGIIICRTGLLAACGLAAGAAFSPPVAVFCALTIPLMDWLNRFRQTTGRRWVRWAFAGDDAALPARILDRMVDAFSYTVDRLIPRLQNLNPAHDLAHGNWIAVAETRRAFLLMLGYGAALLAISAMVLARRQLGAITI